MKCTLILICVIINYGCTYNIYAPTIFESTVVHQKELTVRNKDYPKYQK